MANPIDSLPYPENTRDREESLLGAIAGLNEIPDYPVRTMTRKEMYLKYIAEHGTGGSVTPQQLDNLIDGADDIRVDLSEDDSELIIGTHAKTVEITGVPPTAVEGTLTEEQLAALEESDKSVIKFNNELYFLNDNGHEAGSRGYSHTGVENGVFTLKNITVTLNTRGWVLTEQEVTEASGYTEIVLTGDTGTLTTAEIALVSDGSKDVALANGGQVFRLANKQSDLTYKTYINMDAATGEDLSATAIYVQLNPEAVNYGHWSKEDIDFPGGGPTVVQATGTSTTDVMSQKAVTDEIYQNNDKWRIRFGANAPVVGDNTVCIGGAITQASSISNQVLVGMSLIGAGAGGSNGNVVIGNRMSGASGSVNIGYGYNPQGTPGLDSVTIGLTNTHSAGQGSIQIGRYAKGTYKGSIALGAGSETSAIGEMNIGSTDTSYGYNSTSYRLLTGVHDGINAHDALTVGQANALIDAINAAMNTSIPHIGNAA